MGPRAGLDGQKISSPPGFDPGTSSLWSVAIPTELPGPRSYFNTLIKTLSRLINALINPIVLQFTHFL